MPKEVKKHRVQKYRKEWEKERWANGWLSMARDGQKAFCFICDKALVPWRSELIGHTKSAQHIRLSKQVADNQSLMNFVDSKDFPKVKAELNTVALMVRKNISFNFLD